MAVTQEPATLQGTTDDGPLTTDRAASLRLLLDVRLVVARRTAAANEAGYDDDRDDVRRHREELGWNRSFEDAELHLERVGEAEDQGRRERTDRGTATGPIRANRSSAPNPLWQASTT